MPKRYDIIIIGTGPAGLSAAITAKVRNKEILLLGSRSLSPKLEKAHTILNYLGLPEVSGGNMQKAFLSHIQNMGIEITEKRVGMVYAMGDYFSLTADEETYEGETVILATGVTMEKSYPGEDEFLGRGVSYCATCDAPLYKGREVAVIASDPKEEAEADFVSEVCSRVFYFPLYKGEVHVSEKVTVVRETPTQIRGGMKAQSLVTDKGLHNVDAIFILRDAVAPDKLVPGLAVENNHVAVNRSMETSLPGMFACGDVTGTPYQYIKAAGEGNVAALSAVSFLAQKKRG